MQEINGKEIALQRRQKLAQKVKALTEQGCQPGLAVVLVGDDPASQIYVANKEKACQEAGILSRTLRLPEDTSQEALLAVIADLNADEQIHGILVQLPLPAGLDAEAVIDAIHPDKDVDGFSPTNMGALLVGKESFQPCTPKGCMVLLAEAGCDPAGKKAVVIGRSNIVGKPVAIMLTAKNATVTLCHSQTPDIGAITKDADIVVVAIGQAGFLTPDMVKDGAVLIDVGINRTAEGKVVGDIDQAAFAAADRDVTLTPVPGGVGPMTIAMLLENTYDAALRQKRKEAPDA